MVAENASRKATGLSGRDRNGCYLPTPHTPRSERRLLGGQALIHGTRPRNEASQKPLLSSLTIPAQRADYLIVGAGVFGASTALHLIRKYPGASVVLVDRNAFTAPTRVAASWDWNKVVRADYADITYMRLALEARDVWKTDPLWAPFYHEKGIFWVSRTSFAADVVANYAKLGFKADLYSTPVDEARKEFGGLFDGGDYDGVQEVLVNRPSGRADAKDALQSVIEEAVRLGVRYVEAEVIALELADGDKEKGGGCRGVRTSEANPVLWADRVILSTGAFTPRLLIDSAPERTGLHAGGRILAAAVAEGVAPLTDLQFQKYSAMPVAINHNPPGRGTKSPFS